MSVEVQRFLVAKIGPLRAALEAAAMWTGHWPCHRELVELPSSKFTPGAHPPSGEIDGLDTTRTPKFEEDFLPSGTQNLSFEYCVK